VSGIIAFNDDPVSVIFSGVTDLAGDVTVKVGGVVTATDGTSVDAVQTGKGDVSVTVDAGATVNGGTFGVVADSQNSAYSGNITVVIDGTVNGATAGGFGIGVQAFAYSNGDVGVQTGATSVINATTGASTRGRSAGPRCYRRMSRSSA